MTGILSELGLVTHEVFPFPVHNEHWETFDVGVFRTEHGALDVALLKFAYTSAVILREENNPFVYLDRWCYHDAKAALVGATCWLESENAEPTGWHRHPMTGRRRPDGNPALEYINF
jgi:hypothetical protein